MDMVVMYLEEVLVYICVGKVSIWLLDGICVDFYGSMVFISNVVVVIIFDVCSIVIKLWDKSMFCIIEKVIMDFDLGIIFENNGEIICLGILLLIEECCK